MRDHVVDFKYKKQEARVSPRGKKEEVAEQSTGGKSQVWGKFLEDKGKKSKSETEKAC